MNYRQKVKYIEVGEDESYHDKIKMIQEDGGTIIAIVDGGIFYDEEGE